jgi:hypothetical protein
MKTRIRLLPFMLVLVCGQLRVAEAAPPSFTKKPVMTKAGDPSTGSGPGRAKIQFAADRETDVAVYVEDAQGKIVRHLAAGVLGTNAPPPLESGSLAQVLEWDGKDDDGVRCSVAGVRPQADRSAQEATDHRSPAAAYQQPFRVRVGLGLNVSYAGTAFSDKSGPDNIVNVLGMAVAPDGRLYVLSHRWQKYVAFSTAVHVFLRDGRYEKTIKPFPVSLPEERVKATGAFVTRDEGLIPLVYRSIVSGPSYYPNNDVQHQPVVAPDGRLVLAVTPCNLAILDSDGGISSAAYAGPALGKKGFTNPLPDGRGGLVSFNMPYLTCSADGTKVYMTGLGSVKYIPNAGGYAFNDHALYSAPLAERGPAQVVFGAPAVATNDAAHLNDPRGVAVDGKGHILVADFGNNRVVVLNEKDKTFAGSFPVEAPFWVGASPKSDAIYVGARRATLIKFAGWQDPKEVASTNFIALTKKGHPSQQPGFPLHLALDAGADKPVIWAACNGLPLRLEDQGSSFSVARPIGASAPIFPWNLTADPLRREVSCQGNGIRILDEETGKIATASSPNFSGQMFLMRLGMNGLIYSQCPGYKLQRFDRQGRLIPFEATTGDKELKGALNNGPEGTTYWPRDFCVDRHGDVYVKNRGKEYHGLMTVTQHGPDGALKRVALWAVTDGALGPRVDPQGNLYMAEGVRPPGQAYPEFFKGRLIAGTKDGSSGFTLQTEYGSMDTEYAWMYGSVVKFGPRGGAVWFPKPAVQPFDGEPKLDAALPRMAVSGGRGARMIGGVELQGAEWMRFGYAYLADMSGRGTDRCHCTASDFDVDDFGRTFYPNQGLYRVEVLDTAGNKILTVGGYGNQDCCGPDSYVLDPAGRFMRPRKSDDPKDLVSPFAQPELAFNWFTGLAVTDRYLYVADGNNRRVLRGKLGYAAEEVSEIR